MFNFHLVPDSDVASDVSVEFVLSPDAQSSSMTCSGVLGRHVAVNPLNPLARPFFPPGVDSTSLVSVPLDEVQAHELSPVRQIVSLDSLIYT
jgi:hypothetical protein